MTNKHYYLRRSKRAQLPQLVLFLEVDTYYREEGGFDWHYMIGANTIATTYDKKGTPRKHTSLSHPETEKLFLYIESLASSHSSMLVVGSHITFALFSCDLLARMTTAGWNVQVLHAATSTALLVAQREKNTIRFANLTNWIDSIEELPDSAEPRVKLIAKAFNEYLAFVVKHNMGEFKYTAASQAFTCFRRRFLTEKILHYDQPEFNAYIRAAYFGGRVECGRLGSLADSGYTRIDINSLYPYVMSTNRYPTKFRQWCRNPNLKYLRKRAQDSGCVAECLVATDEPIYAIQRNGSTVFPTGTFTARLCTGTLQIALERGHVRSCSQLATFDTRDLFSGFVGYFYPLKARYRAAGMAIWTGTVKGILNKLYGKFGERHDHVIWEGDGDDGDLYAHPCLVPAADVPDGDAKFNWRYVAEKETGELHVAATERSCMGRKWITAGYKEGTSSAPAIAAHVTDYGRAHLWLLIEKLGLENMLYCDTDSLIFESQHLDKLLGEINAEEIGKLRILGEATSLEIRGCKNYTFGGEDIIAGKPKNAIWQNHRLYTARYFPNPTRVLQPRAVAGAPIGAVTKSVLTRYSKGDVLGDGTITRFLLEEGS